jgi:hypothetical protein
MSFKISPGVVKIDAMHQITLTCHVHIMFDALLCFEHDNVGMTFPTFA